jgi:two-component system response regulator GlrR
MDLPEILLINLEPTSCPGCNCKQIAKLLRKILPGISVILQTGIDDPSAMTISSCPHLILLRFSSPVKLHKAVQSLKVKWSTASILGIFCNNTGAPAEGSGDLLNYLDDFLCCPYKEVELHLRIQRLLQQGRGRSTTDLPNIQLKASSGFEGLLGNSEAFLRIIGKISNVARSDATVLLIGETGTGKERVAHTIHDQSSRRVKPFIAVNCGALPDQLIENELFGHSRGAYTGASSSEKGLLAEAEEGTLFLDEVNSLTLSAQVKLLRFLQDREYRPLGSTKSYIADVRIIAATNVNLLEQVQAKQFRSDLYYRLHVVSIHIPSLIERIEDIPLLAEHFLSLYGSRYGRGSLRFTPACLQKLIAYRWPGNIRELEGVIQQGIIMSSSPILQPDDIELPSDDIGLPEPDSPEPNYPEPDYNKEVEDISFSQAKSRTIERGEDVSFSQAKTRATERGEDAPFSQAKARGTERGEDAPFRQAKTRAIEEFERSYLARILTIHKGNITQAAKSAGKERSSFQRLLRKYGLDRSSFDNASGQSDQK